MYQIILFKAFQNQAPPVTVMCHNLLLPPLSRSVSIWFTPTPPIRTPTLILSPNPVMCTAVLCNKSHAFYYIISAVTFARLQKNK